MRYTALIWAVLLGYVVWGHVPDTWVAIGAAVIVASGVYIIRAESRAASSKAAADERPVRVLQPPVNADERR